MYKTVTLPILIYAFNEKADGTSNFLPGFEGLRPVRVFRTTETPEFWKSVGGAGRTEFNAVVQLLQAINSGDRLAAKNASVQLAKTKSSELGKLVSEVAAKFESYPQTQLDEAISERLKSARLVLWSSRGKPVPAIFCPDNMTALFVSALLGRVSGRNLAVCPKCGAPFVQKRPNEKYCSIRHREAHRVARWRASKTTKKKKGRK
jgi:hypothetical protein